MLARNELNYTENKKMWAKEMLIEVQNSLQVLLPLRANDIAFLNSGNQNSTFTILDSTAINPIIQIVTTELPDTIKPGWLILDTTGVGRLILVTDYTIEKSGNDFMPQWHCPGNFQG